MHNSQTKFYLNKKWFRIGILLFYLLLLGSVLPLPAVAFDADYTRLAPIFKVGINNRFLAFSTNSETIKFEHLFNLSTMAINDDRLSSLSFRSIEQGWGEYSITFGAIGNHNRSRLELRHLGRTIHEIDWSDLPGERHNVCGFIKNDLWITGGYRGVLEVYNFRAEKVAALEGHTGAISSIAFNDHWLVSGDDNGLLIVWDLGDIVNGKKTLLPYLKLVFAKDGEWIIWSEDGLFASSARGHTLLHLADALLPLYRKPELLAKKISAPQQYHRVAVAELKNAGSIFNEPTVTLLNLPAISQQRDLEVTTRICDTGGGIQSATLFLQGVPIAIEEAVRGVTESGKAPTAAKETCRTYARVISLTEGDNQLQLVANNLFGKASAPAKAVVTFQPGKKRKAQLHIATIAVSNYGDSKLVLKYPVADAKTIGNALEKTGSMLFTSVNIYPLFDAAVTKNGLSAFFADLKGKIHAEDIFILFISGHGLFTSDDGNYYFLPVDITSKNLLQTAITTEELMQLLAKVTAAQTMLLFDTYQSSSFDGFAKGVQQINSSQLQFARRLGRTAIMSCTTEQAAFEGVRGHSAFTSVILDALGDGGDYTSDQLITADELSVYVSKQLPELTERKWGYRQETVRNSTGHDFALGSLNH